MENRNSSEPPWELRTCDLPAQGGAPAVKRPDLGGIILPSNCSGRRPSGGRWSIIPSACAGCAARCHGDRRGPALNAVPPPPRGSPLGWDPSLSPGQGPGRPARCLPASQTLPGVGREAPQVALRGFPGPQRVPAARAEPRTGTWAGWWEDRAAQSTPTTRGGRPGSVDTPPWHLTADRLC